MNHKRIISTIWFTGIAFIINYLITLFLTPYITDTVGTDAYGFVSLAKNFAQYATYVTLALNSFATRFISVEYHRKNYKKANIYFSSTFFGDVILAGIVFAVALICILNLQHFLKIPENIQKDVKILFLFVFVKFLLATVMSVYESGAMISNRLYITGIFKIISYLTEAATLLVLFHAFKSNVFFIGVSLLTASCVTVASNYWITRHYTPELNIHRKSFQMNAVKELVGNGLWSSVNSLGSFLNTGLDLMMCNLMLSPIVMGQLAIAESIGMIFKSIQPLMAQPFQPALLKSYAENDKERLLSQLSFAMKISSMISNICFAGFFSLGLTYYKLWIPNQDIHFIWRLTVISTISSFTGGIVYPLFFIYTLTLKKKIPCIFTLSAGALNVISMYFLIRYTNLGAYAVVWTTSILIPFINFVAHPLYMAHVLDLPAYHFYPGILRCVLSGMIISIAMKGMSYIYLPETWITFFMTALIYAGIGGLLHISIAFNKREKESVRRIASGLR